MSHSSKPTLHNLPFHFPSSAHSVSTTISSPRTYSSSTAPCFHTHHPRTTHRPKPPSKRPTTRKQPTVKKNPTRKIPIFPPSTSPPRSSPPSNSATVMIGTPSKHKTRSAAAPGKSAFGPSSSKRPRFSTSSTGVKILSGRIFPAKWISRPEFTFPSESLGNQGWLELLNYNDAIHEDEVKQFYNSLIIYDNLSLISTVYDMTSRFLCKTWPNC